jgi:hypothetical protein
MRVRKIVSIAFYGTMLIAGIIVTVAVQVGPRATGPSEDPVARLNREHADVADNADELYVAAFAVTAGEPPDGRDWHIGQPVPPMAAKLVAANEEALRLVRQATARANYWHPLTSDAPGVVLGDLSRFRRIARLLWWKAQIAIEHRDSNDVADSLAQVARLGQHCGQTPLLVHQLVGVGCLSLAQEGLLEPLRWPELSAEARRAYIDLAATVCTPPPSLAESLAIEEDQACWTYAAQNKGKLSATLTPLARAYGEFRAAFAPVRALADQTPEEQARADNPLRLAAVGQAKDKSFTLSAPKKLARILAAAPLRAMSLQTRVITVQRGNRTVLELFRIKDQTGELPASLDAVTGDFRIDPYSGRPLVYRRTGEDFVLYSVGIDGDDDGGTHHAKFGERPAPEPNQPTPPPDGDYVFWPIPRTDR